VCVCCAHIAIFAAPADALLMAMTERVSARVDLFARRVALSASVAQCRALSPRTTGACVRAD
jgi:hypothetical protein